MTLDDTAARINSLFYDYGLADPVVEVREITSASPGNMISHTSLHELRFINDHDPNVMALRLFTLEEIFRGYFEAHPKSDQLRLF